MSATGFLLAPTMITVEVTGYSLLACVLTVLTIIVGASLKLARAERRLIDTFDVGVSNAASLKSLQVSVRVLADQIPIMQDAVRSDINSVQDRLNELSVDVGVLKSKPQRSRSKPAIFS